MITNNQSDLLYFADTLRRKFPAFTVAREEKLKLLDINYSELQSTKDIWCRDYMPIQIERDRFVQFQYPPSYLKNQKYKASITNTDEVCQKLNITKIKSYIVLDGGNVVCSEKR